MHFKSGHTDREKEISELFLNTFTASEGPEEGNLIRALVDRVMQTTPDADRHVFSAYQDDLLVGAIFFTRLTFSADERTVFILSPVAVRTQKQNRGIGQKLIAHGLAELRKAGVCAIVTYGDPTFYAKVGFRQITEDVAHAPLPLSFPHGWLGQSLTSEPLTPLNGTSRCVEALNRPDLW